MIGSTPASWLIGLGASAGGLRALEEFFGRCPDDLGAAFVVVQHLSPDFKSLMVELLARHTGMAICRVEDGMVPTADTVYLMPPKVVMEITDGAFHLRPADEGTRPELPIDAFFVSIAAAYGSRAIAVVLSGTGSDGSRGVRSVHEAGGLVLVQSEATAEFDGMPHNAIATQVADRIVAPGEMPDLVRRFVAGGSLPSGEGRHLPDPLADILDLLAQASGIDFSAYKRTTVQRRIERRMGIRAVTALADYRTLLRADEHEVADLLHDLLIGVTSFFRDTEAFAHLREAVLPGCFERAARANELRVWVAGCATGEEAYSLAALLQEQARACSFTGRIRIFATDVHRPAVASAAAGGFSEDAIAGLDGDQRAALFDPAQDGRHQVRRSLRDLVVFAPHNLLTDPPFTGIDLITCRNLLIYLEPRFQDFVLGLFHYALNLDGVLFLGPSEGLGRLEEDYQAIDSRWKLFRKTRHRVLPLDLERTAPPRRTQLRVSPLVPAAPTTSGDRRLLRDYDAVLAFCHIDAVLIDCDLRPRHVFGQGGRFLGVPSGRIETDLLGLTSGDLRIALGSLLQRAAKEGRAVVARGVRLDDQRLVDCTVQPLPRNEGQQRLLVVFAGEREVPNLPAAEDGSAVNEQLRQRVADLELELATTKENLQATIEELQTTNEELQSTNEELQAANEELQSANEELHSVNEELYTVNAEYEAKNRQLQELNRDHENLLASSDVGTVFLDDQLRIRKFNQAVDRFLHLLPQDVGRPIDHIAYHLPDHDQFLDDLRSVLGGGSGRSREVADRDGAWLWRRALPFCGDEGETRGVVLTFTDIEPLKRAEAAAVQHERRFRVAIEQSVDAFALLEAVHDSAGTVVGLTVGEANSELEGLLGRRRADLVGRPAEEVLPLPEPGLLAGLLTVLDSDATLQREFAFRSPGRGQRWLSLRAKTAGSTVACSWLDLTERRRAEEELAAARDAAQEANQAKSRFLATLSHELRTPLNGAIGAAELLLDGDLDQDQRELLEMNLACSQQLTSLIADLLDYGAIGSGRLELRPTTVNLYDLLEQVAAMACDLARKRGLELIVDWHPGLPETAHLDGPRLTQILLNLVSNAVKYTPAGVVALDAEPDHDRGRIRLRIDDSGPGVPASDRERIFDPFIQAEMGTTRRHGGVGLGLAVVSDLVELMAGTVAVDDCPLGGARFTVDIPVDFKHQETAPPLAGLRVAIVERDSRHCHGLGSVLEHLGAEATIFCGAEGGPMTWAQGQDAVILSSDIFARRDPPWADLERLRQDCRVPALLLVPRNRMGEAHAEGARHLVPRPLRRRHLVRQFLELGLGEATIEADHGQPRVLVVDDNAEARELLLVMLGRFGARVLLADGCDAALAIQAAGDVDLVLMDLHMPTVDGWETTRRLRALGGSWATVPILAVTATNNPPEHRRCLEVGMQEVLVKPVRNERLAEALATWTSLRP